MWKKFKESRFCQTAKKICLNRAVVISTVTVLLALAVVLTVTVAANRAKRNNTDTPQEKETEKVTDSEQKKPDEKQTEKETEKKDSPTAADTMPTSFLIPLEKGSLAKEHDESVQVFSNTMQDFRVHLGVDVRGNENAPVLASADGTVKEIWDDPMMGKCIALSHGGDCCTVYKNLAENLPDGIEVGKEVKAGDPIAYVGESAMIESADAPHVHMEITVGGIAVDPMEYLDRDSFAAEDVFEDEVQTGMSTKTGETETGAK